MPMREMIMPLSAEMTARIRRAVADLFAAAPTRREIQGQAYAMEESDLVVVQEADFKLADGQRLRVAATTPEARPPFEWLWEVTSDIGEADYFKHYLIREEDIVLAERKSLYPIDDEEGRLILHDLGVVTEALEAGALKSTRSRRS